MGDMTYGIGAHAFTLATGSPGELGLLAALAEVFCHQHAARLHWIKAGTGESLRLLRERRADIALVHAPGMVERAVAEGWASLPTPFGGNRYCLLGPIDDPADVKTASDAVDAFRRIALSGRPFVSRGDDSGTHHKELELWQAAGSRPDDENYIVARAFMTDCLLRADAARAYFLCDSSTWVMQRGLAPHLALLYDADPALVNRYHALVAPPGTTPGRETAARFARFLVAADGQAILRSYGQERFGQPLYEGSGEAAA